MNHAPPTPSIPRVKWYFVVVAGPNAGSVVDGPYPGEPDPWVRKHVEDECEAAVAAELLTPGEAQEMKL